MPKRNRVYYYGARNGEKKKKKEDRLNVPTG